ncbi:MAG: hypothetical protein JO235_11920 [Chroococcidiopsidaceae cyanobacterium CP_BM_RX_35]|nr:hypothetical protein [Chroococcidiopsidaceae cyanobacterium CP_BM_RX_35]
MNRFYTLLTNMLPENEHEELRGEMKELYWHLLEEKHHSRTEAMLWTSWQGLMFVTGMCFDNVVFKTGTFQEEAFRLKSFFGKLYGFCFILLFPILCFTQGSLTLLILLTVMSIGWLWMSLEWTFNHKKTLRVYGGVVALLAILLLLMITLFPQQRQVFYLYMSSPLAALLLAAGLGAAVYGWGLHQYWGESEKYLSVIKKNQAAFDKCFNSDGLVKLGLDCQIVYKKNKK